MKNVYHTNECNSVVLQVHVEPPPTPLIEINHNYKSEKYFVQMELHRYPASYKLDPYEFKMTLFNNGELEEVWLFVRSFNMTLVASGTLDTAVNMQYLRTLVCGEALHQFDFLYSGAEVTNSLTAENIF